MTIKARKSYSLTPYETEDWEGRHGPGNEANRAKLFEVHGRKTTVNEQVTTSEHGFHVTDPMMMSGSSTTYPPKPRETKMSEPDAFGRTRRVYADTGGMVDNDNNTAAMAKTMRDAQLHQR